jgi:MFS family permease/quinol monooxygenase YgiN
MSPWSPFKHKAYTVLWVAGLVSNIGTWVFNVASGWLMTELSPSALMVSLVQVATAVPIFLLALPAGALGDLFDRRKLLLICQLSQAVFLFLFAFLLHHGESNAWLLLFFTFLTGVGSAFATPAFQAIVPQLVPREVLRPAITMNGIGINIARALGPALGGFLLTTASAAAAVLLDASSFLVVAAGVFWWRSAEKKPSAVPPERVMGAMISSIRFVRFSEAARATLWRAFAFFLFASAYWALLPLIAKVLLNGGPSLYGLLLTAIGAGAVSAAFFLPRLESLSADATVMLGTVGTACGLLLFALGKASPVGLLAGFVTGISWILVLSSLNVSMQIALPDWMRARGMALFQVVFFGAMTVGSLGWGQLASEVGLRETLIVSAVGALIGIVVSKGQHLNLGEFENHEPSRHWSEPNLTCGAHDLNSPVIVIVEYRVLPSGRERFLQTVRELGTHRQRTGALSWDIVESAEEPGLFLEVFREISWPAHLRTHERVSESVRALQEVLSDLHQGEESPKVVHALTPRMDTVIDEGVVTIGKTSF